MKQSELDQSLLLVVLFPKKLVVRSVNPTSSPSLRNHALHIFDPKKHVPKWQRQDANIMRERKLAMPISLRYLKTTLISLMIHPAGYYESMTDEALHNEVKSRGINPEDFQTRDDAIAHLQLDDEAVAADPREATPQGLDDKAVATHDGQTTRAVPSDLDEYEGQYVHAKDPIPGEVFGLKVIESARHDKTHHLKSQIRFGDYTKEEFRAQFDKL